MINKAQTNNKKHLATEQLFKIYKIETGYKNSRVQAEVKDKVNPQAQEYQSVKINSKM